MNIRIALATSAALAALAFSTAHAGREWFQDYGGNTWTHYNYLDFDRHASVGVDEWGVATFGFGSNETYFLHYITNNTTTAHCYEIELKEPENYPSNNSRIELWFWDQAAGAWTDLLGFAGKGKARLWLKKSTLQAFLATSLFPSGSSPRQNGFWLSRKSLTEAQCTTGQTTMNWLKIIDGTQSKNIKAR